jgi:hypothetical protein
MKQFARRLLIDWRCRRPVATDVRWFDRPDQRLASPNWKPHCSVEGGRRKRSVLDYRAMCQLDIVSWRQESTAHIRRGRLSKASATPLESEDKGSNGDRL